jgi:hypothetical protein
MSPPNAAPEEPHFNRPPGRARRGMSWNHSTGEWQVRRRPCGRAPKGMVWSALDGEWVEEGEEGASAGGGRVEPDEPQNHAKCAGCSARLAAAAKATAWACDLCDAWKKPADEPYSCTKACDFGAFSALSPSFSRSISLVRSRAPAAFRRDAPPLCRHCAALRALPFARSSLYSPPHCDVLARLPLTHRCVPALPRRDAGKARARGRKCGCKVARQGALASPCEPPMKWDRRWHTVLVPPRGTSSS